MARQWSPDDVLKLASSYQQACVLAAAADLDLFSAMAGRSLKADAVAEELAADPRATAILLDALAALELLDKRGDTYSVPAGVVEVLTARGKTSKYKGVTRDKKRSLWRSTAWYKGRSIHVGRYTNEAQAARAVDYVNVQLNGEYAYLNFPDEWPEDRIEAVYKAARAARRKLSRQKARQSTTKGTKKARRRRTGS